MLQLANSGVMGGGGWIRPRPKVGEGTCPVLCWRLHFLTLSSTRMSMTW